MIEPFRFGPFAYRFEKWLREQGYVPSRSGSPAVALVGRFLCEYALTRRFLLAREAEEIWMHAAFIGTIKCRKKKTSLLFL